MIANINNNILNYSDSILKKRMDISRLYENKSTIKKLCNYNPYLTLSQFIESLSAKEDIIIFYSVGEISKLIINLFNLNTNTHKNIVFCDKNSDDIDEFYGFPVISPTVLLNDYKNNLIAIMNYNYQNDIYNFLLSSGIKANNIIFLMTNEISEFLTSSRKMVPQNNLLEYFVLNILDHCNLNCQCCDHFACIADKNFVTLQNIEKDVFSMTKIMDGNVNRIGIMGGEPLLHPDLLEIIRLTRKAFPDTNIQLVTNGILLLKQKKEFWKCCYHNKIVIVNTKYPLNIDYESIASTAKSYNVTLEFYGDTGEIVKTSYKAPLDLDGKQHPVKSFCNCYHANNLPLFMNGNLYACTIAPNIHHFNKYFGTDLRLEKKDILTILEDTTKEDIFEFLSSPKPFCRYCITHLRSNGIPWSTSRRIIDEWLI